MRQFVPVLLAAAMVPFSGLAQDGPVSDTTSEALIEALTPKPGLRLRGISVTAAPASVDLAVEFAYNSADLTEEARTLLSELAEALNSEILGAYRFALAGHTDAVGSDAYNQALSLARAQSVQAYLSNKFGIDPVRLDVQGLGETQLLFPNAPEDGRNRRVEIKTLE